MPPLASSVTPLRRAEGRVATKAMPAVASTVPPLTVPPCQVPRARRGVQEQRGGRVVQRAGQVDRPAGAVVGAQALEGEEAPEVDRRGVAAERAQIEPGGIVGRGGRATGLEGQRAAAGDRDGVAGVIGPGVGCGGGDGGPGEGEAVAVLRLDGAVVGPVGAAQGDGARRGGEDLGIGRDRPLVVEWLIAQIDLAGSAVDGQVRAQGEHTGDTVVNQPVRAAEAEGDGARVSAGAVDGLRRADEVEIAVGRTGRIAQKDRDTAQGQPA